MLYAAVPSAVAGSDQPSAVEQRHAMNLTPEGFKWDKIFPELGEQSAEITMLREDPNTHATQLMIRIPKNFHVPLHWHTAGETITIVNGTFILECEGTRAVLTQGAFNYMPGKMTHEAWTEAKEGALLFITVDGKWDINWVAGPPKRSDVIRE